MKHEIWTVACGGYKEASTRVFATRKEAEDYMKEEYEDQIMVHEIEDKSMCYIDDEYAEPYNENMDFDDVFVFHLERHIIDLPDKPNAETKNSKGLTTYQLLREDSKYGTDISLTFMAKNYEEAKHYAHILALKALQEDYDHNPNGNWEDAWVSLYDGSYENEYGVIGGVDIDNIGDTLNYNITYTLREPDSIENCKNIASIKDEDAKLLDIAYKIDKKGIFEPDMKKVFQMIKNGISLAEIENKMDDILSS